MCKKLIAVCFAFCLAVFPLFACCGNDSTRVTKSGFLPHLPDGTAMEFKEVSEAEFMRSFRPRLMVAHGEDVLSGKNILDDTRYSPTFPTSDTPFDTYTDLWKLLQYEVDSGLFNPDLARSKKFEPSNIVSEAVKQRAIDLVDNANNGNTKALQDTYCFIAKRKIYYPTSSDYEVDYLYCWYDYNHTNNGSFEGVTLGNFYMQPNTIVLCRFNSNGYSTTAYTSADEFPLSLNTVINFSWDMSKKSYSITNSDGTVETLDYSGVPSGFYPPQKQYFLSNVNSNSITDNFLQSYYNYDSTKYNHVFGDVLTNIQCICSNGLYWNGSSPVMIFNNISSADWYISSGGFFPSDNIGQSINQNFSTDLNVNPKLPPVYNNYNTTNNTFKSNTYLTTDNVSNYYDYGITYNQDSGEYQLDMDVLTAQIEADITPKFDFAFKGVYENQPDIGGDFTTNDNNYIDITDKYIIDIVDKYYPATSCTVPTYPAVDTAPLVSYTYPVLPTETVPQSVLDDVGTVVGIGFDTFDTLGTAIMGTLIALAVLGAVSYYIWG